MCHLQLCYCYTLASPDTFWINSGKSTLFLTLLRLLDMKSGTIKVDSLDLSLIPRSLVRQRCFITIAQDAFILGQASLRFNLDVSISHYLCHHKIVGQVITNLLKSPPAPSQVRQSSPLSKGHVSGPIFTPASPQEDPNSPSTTPSRTSRRCRRVSSSYSHSPARLFAFVL